MLSLLYIKRFLPQTEPKKSTFFSNKKCEEKNTQTLRKQRTKRKKRNIFAESKSKVMVK